MGISLPTLNRDILAIFELFSQLEAPREPGDVDFVLLLPPFFTGANPFGQQKLPPGSISAEISLKQSVRR